MGLGKVPCGCAKAALDLSAAYFRHRIDCIRLIDDAIAASIASAGQAGAEEEVASLLARAMALASAEKQAAVKAEQEAIKAEQAAAAAAAKLEREATKAAKAAEAEAAKAAKEAQKALAKARAKEEAEEAARQAKERQAALELDAKALEQARALARVQAKEADRRSKAEREEQKRLAKEAKEAEAALSAEAKRERREAAAAEAEARKVAADRARMEAERAKEEASAVAQREREEREERKAAERAAERVEGAATAKDSPSAASSISQQRLERANSRFGSRFGSFSGFGSSSSAAKAEAEEEGGARAVHTNYAKAYKKIGQGRGGSDSSTATKALKAASNEEDANLATKADQPPELDIPLAKPLTQWRGAGGGLRDAELHATPGFCADCIAVGSDGDTLVGIGGDGDGKSVSTYSASGKCMLQSFHGHADLVCSVAIRADQLLIASGSRDKTIRLWHPSSGECTATLEGCEDMVCGLTFHPLSERRDWLLSGEKSGRIRLWSIDTAEAITSFNAEHSGPVWSVAMGARCAVSASHDAKAKVWPLPDITDVVANTTRSRATLTHPTWVFSVSVADTGRHLGELAATGCGDRLVRLWGLAGAGAYECLRTFSHGFGLPAHPVLSVQLAGGLLASGGRDGHVRLWSLARDDEPCLATLKHGEDVHGVAVSPTHGFVATCGGASRRLVIWRAK